MKNSPNKTIEQFQAEQPDPVKPPANLSHQLKEAVVERISGQKTQSLNSSGMDLSTRNPRNAPRRNATNIRQPWPPGLAKQSLWNIQN
jgi:hypothetical protein